MTITIKKAVKHESKLRLAIIAPSGAGKTYTSLLLATTLAQGKPIAVIDTERGSASKYADLFNFDVVELESFAPRQYVEALKELEKAGYAVIVVDSLSHAWMGKDGALEMVDKEKSRSSGNNSFTAWRSVTPEHNALIDAIVSSKAHVITTMRSKTEYVMESITENGRSKQVPRKVGLAPIQRDGVEFEFDVIGEMDQENTMVITKSRCPVISNEVIKKPGKQLGETLLNWLSGAPQSEIATAPTTARTTQNQPAPTNRPATSPSAPQASRSASTPAPAPPVTPASTNTPNPAVREDVLTSQQLAGIKTIGRTKGLDDVLLKKKSYDRFGRSVETLSQDDAAKFIVELQKV